MTTTLERRPIWTVLGPIQKEKSEAKKPKNVSFPEKLV